MFSSSVARNATRAIRPVRGVAASVSRPFSSSVLRANDASGKKKDPLINATTKAPEGAVGPHDGKYARTDENVKIEYPDETGVPPTPIVRGRGGIHFKRTLPEFTLENKVSVVTGGARGLGLVMAQALVTSGSDVAIVDLNSKRPLNS